MRIKFWKQDEKPLPDTEDLYLGNQTYYIARHILLGGNIIPLDNKGIKRTDKAHVHAVLVGTDDICLALLRHIALLAHYPNFDDETGANRTKITIISPAASTLQDMAILQDAVRAETGNLLDIACVTHRLHQDGGWNTWEDIKPKSFVDVEFELVGLNNTAVSDYFRDIADSDSTAIVSVFAQQGLLGKEDMQYAKSHYLQHYEIETDRLRRTVTGMTIDTRRARLVNAIYRIGTHLKQVCSSDIYDVCAYDMSLSTFVKHTPGSKVNELWSEIMKNYENNPLYATELKLSNVYSADTFEGKIRSIGGNKSDLKGLKNLLSSNIEALARSEHARWNVEKLIMKFRPYSPDERYLDEFKFGAEVQKSRSDMKKQHKVHIDLCSCNELIRINPENFKYDCFLVLAINDILAREQSLYNH